MSDLISRQAAIDGADEIIKRDTIGNNAVVEAMKAWKLYIGNLPSAEPVRHGKWIETEFLKLRECSCCHVRWGMYDTENFTYCPDCGARMDEE